MIINKKNKQLIADLWNKPYEWGEIQHIHEIGEYVIVEYLEKNISADINKDKKLNHRHFSPFINGKNICRGYNSLDEALIGIIAYKLDGPNTRIDEYFIKAVSNK